MKIFLWSLLGTLCFFMACQRQDILDEPVLPEQQEVGAADRDDSEFTDYLSFVIEGSSFRECCTAEYCKYITNPTGNILCGFDYSQIYFAPGSFAYHIFTPSSPNPTVKVRYRLKIEKLPPPPPPGSLGSVTTVVDVIIPAGFLPTCQERMIVIHPDFTPDCNAKYNVYFQIIQGLPNGTSQVCTTNTQYNLSFCGSTTE